MSKVSLNNIYAMIVTGRNNLKQIVLCEKQPNSLYFIGKDIRWFKNLASSKTFVKLCNYKKGAFFYNDKLPVIDNVPFSPKTKIGLTVKMENNEPMVEIHDLIKYEKKYNKELLKNFNKKSQEDLTM